MKFYSQFQQDRFAYENYLKDKNKGYFVDIGAFDGEIDSNSLFFENLGWEGICLEPNPEAFKKLQKIRKCKCLPYAISNKNETTQFFQIKEGGPAVLSGLVNEFSQQAIARINENLDETTQEFDYIDVECKTFDSIVDVYNIDFLSLDTEGNELKILQSIDFSKYNIDVITVENNDYDDKFINFLTNKNYNFVTRLGCDEFYKKNN
jgi:FkbM family methyltransferase